MSSTYNKKVVEVLKYIAFKHATPAERAAFLAFETPNAISRVLSDYLKVFELSQVDDKS